MPGEEQALGLNYSTPSGKQIDTLNKNVGEPYHVLHDAGCMAKS